MSTRGDKSKFIKQNTDSGVKGEPPFGEVLSFQFNKKSHPDF